jgi:glycosyltransferase involved in cell wall biosynthesis
LQPPSISIVTPCLDAAATIEEAVASVRAQDYPHVEHVVVDGGSTDGTLAILDRLGVRYVSEPDRGRAHAVNKGVALTSGDVIAWLNADDVYDPGALAAVGEAFTRTPEALWVTGYCPIIDADGEEIRGPVASYKNWLLRHYSYRLYLTQNFVSDPATFVRRTALPVEGPLQERFAISHDYDLWLHVAAQGDPVVLERPLARFRMTEGTVSMEGFELQFREHAQVARERGAGHPLAVAVNRLMSRLIVLVYHVLRLRRRRA